MNKIRRENPLHISSRLLKTQNLTSSKYILIGRINPVTFHWHISVRSDERQCKTFHGLITEGSKKKTPSANWELGVFMAGALPALGWP